MTLLKIAFRNVLKNRRRSLITIMAIAFGYMAVVVFRGYTHNAYERMALGAIFLEGPGHVVLFKKGFHEEGRTDPARYYFSGAEVREIRRLLEAEPGVVWAGPKLTLSGLVTNGDISTIFLADALDPADEARLWAHWSFPEAPTIGGRLRLRPDEPQRALFGPELARILGLDAGDTAVLMATTVDGQMNAVDVVVGGLWPTFSDATDDKYIKMPLAVAQDLYAFDGADRIGVLLEDKQMAHQAKDRLLRSLARKGYQLEASTWDELSLYYRKAKDFLDVVFVFLFLIVLLIVVMSTFNTMSMAVGERTREIGTLRAMGMRPRTVVRMFVVEGSILGALGCLAGSGLTLVCYATLRVARFTYQPPGVSEAVPIAIDLPLPTLAAAVVFFVVLAAAAAALPARRAARRAVVDALTHI